MELHLLVSWCFVLTVSGLMTSHALSHGPGRCWNTISALITVRETFAESMTKRTATCCDWFCASKCSSYRVVYRTAYRNALRTLYKMDLGCCPGWRPQEGHCVPASIPDGRAEATLVPFQPGGPPVEPRASGANQADTGTSSGTPSAGNSYIGQGKNQQAGSTGGAVNSEPRLPSRGAPHEGDVYVIKKSRSNAWATSHPVEMSVIVCMLGIVVVVILVGWTMYKKRITRNHPVMIQLYKAEEMPGTCEAGAFQYEVLPKTDARTSSNTQQVETATAPSVMVLPEDHIYQNFPLFKSRALRINKNIVLMATQRQRGSVYEINLEDGTTSERYTKLNVGDRQSSSSYTPLHIENVNIPSTSTEHT